MQTGHKPSADDLLDLAVAFYFPHTSAVHRLQRPKEVIGAAPNGGIWLQKELQKPFSMDGLNQRFGPGTLSVASVGLHHGWTMRRENKKPSYTTNWVELPLARAN